LRPRPFERHACARPFLQRRAVGRDTLLKARRPALPPPELRERDAEIVLRRRPVERHAFADDAGSSDAGRRCDLKPTNGSYFDGDSNNRCALFSVAIRKPLIRQVKPQKRNKESHALDCGDKPRGRCTSHLPALIPPTCGCAYSGSTHRRKKGPASPCQGINGSGGVASALSKSGATLAGATAISTGMSSPSTARKSG
jgi:hypothetical protein